MPNGLRQIAIEIAREQGIRLHESGTIVVIQGPRFSTKAESAWFTRNGWQVVGMTQYPEAILSKELGMCYTGIALITDYDAGLVNSTGEAVSVEQVLKTLSGNNDRVKDLILSMVAHLPAAVPAESCTCESEASLAVMNGA